MYKIISFSSALLLPIIVSLLTFGNVTLINNVSKFLIENTVTIIGIILSVNCATSLGVFNIFLERAEENPDFMKYFNDVKREIRHNLTLLITLFFISIIFILLEKAGICILLEKASIEAKYFFLVSNFVLISSLILSAFALWELVCFYGLGIPPNIRKD